MQGTVFVLSVSFGKKLGRHRLEVVEASDKTTPAFTELIAGVRRVELQKKLPLNKKGELLRHLVTFIFVHQMDFILFKKGFRFGYWFGVGQG